MRISVIRPSLLEKAEYDSTTVFVIIDTFRATTTLSTLKDSGVKRFYVVKNKEEAGYLKQKYYPNSLLIGEEHGLKIEGFDYGNSPTALLGKKLSSKQVIFTSSNGAKTMLLLEPNQNVFLAALVNLSSVSTKICDLVEKIQADILIVPAGVYENPNHYAIEDWITAVYFVEKINEKLRYSLHVQDVFWNKTKELLNSQEDIGSLLIKSEAGQHLAHIGYSEDVHFALKIDKHSNFLKVKKWLNFDGLKCVEIE